MAYINLFQHSLNPDESVYIRTNNQTPKWTVLAVHIGTIYEIYPMIRLNNKCMILPSESGQNWNHLTIIFDFENHKYGQQPTTQQHDTTRIPPQRQNTA